MPRTFVRKTERGKWTREQLESALNEIRNGISIRSVAKRTGIPFSTLQERLKKGINTGPSLGRSTIFTKKEEIEMVNHVKLLANIFYGISPNNLCRAAFEFAEKKGTKHNFNQASRMAGRDWLNGFLARNASISIRKPEATSVSRIKGFNRVEVTRFFENLEDVMGKHNFTASRIFNVDETGIGTVQEPGKILAPKGQKRVGSVTSWERSKNVTAICAMSASGIYVPPMFIFPRQRMSPTLEKGGPPDSIYRCSKNGWSNEALFIDWLKHFVKHVKPEKENPALLFLDNHYSHITIEAYNFFKDNGIVVVSIPPHTSHRLQPLDVTFFGPLKKAYNRQCDVFIKTRIQKIIRPDDVASLFHKAYADVATLQKAENGFKATGIYPLNINLFSDEDFIHVDIQENDAVQHPQTPMAISNGSGLVNLPPTSEPESSINLSFAAVSPVPGPSCAVVGRSRSKQHSEIVTGTPMKSMLEEKKRKREEKQRPKDKENKESKKKKSCIKILSKQFDDSSSDIECVDEKDLCDDDSDDDIECQEEKCLICDDYGKDGEMWFRCTGCGLWAHSECSGWENPDNYTCDMCERRRK